MQTTMKTLASVDKEKHFVSLWLENLQEVCYLAKDEVSEMADKHIQILVSKCPVKQQE